MKLYIVIKHIHSWVICGAMYTILMPRNVLIDMYHNCLPEKSILITFCGPSQLLIFSVLTIKYSKITIDCI